jgi:hypothetical protein
MDIIKLDVPIFIKLMELARENLKTDEDIHNIAEIVTTLSLKNVVTMDDYSKIINFAKEQGEDELDTIRRLGGIK